MKDVLIIGAGPAGLTAAWELIRKAGDEYRPIIVESSDFVGGLARTFNYKGNFLDMGGHRFFTKSQEVENAWKSLDPTLFERKDRKSRILFERRFFDYPLRITAKTVMQLGLLRTMSSGFSYVAARLRKRPDNSLEDFYINRFGSVLYRLFFEDYTTKVWGVHPRNLSPDWGAQRVKGLSLTNAILSMAKKPFQGKYAKNVETSLTDWFFYPAQGPGQYWETMAHWITENGGVIHHCRTVEHFETRTEDERVIITSAKMRDVRSGDTEHLKVDAVFSSIPLKSLVRALGSIVARDVFEIAQALPYRDFLTVGMLVSDLGLKNQNGNLISDNWIYVQDNEVDLGRIQIFNNWSSAMVADPDNTVWLGLEYFCSEGDDLWDSDDSCVIAKATEELISLGLIHSEQVLDATVVRVKKAYPGYFGSYAHIDEIRVFLDRVSNLFCIGRNGQHRYNNMDHSMLTAFAAVRCLLDPERPKSNLWQVNTESAFHE